MDPSSLTQLKELRATVAAGDVAAPSPGLASFLDKVRRHAYKITDEDVQGLLAAGLTQEQIYEATMHASLSAAIERFELGLRALEGVT